MSCWYFAYIFLFPFFYFCVCFLFWLVLLLKAREKGRQNWVGREAGKIRDDLGKGKYCTKNILFCVSASSSGLLATLVHKGGGAEM